MSDSGRRAVVSEPINLSGDQDDRVNESVSDRAVVDDEVLETDLGVKPRVPVSVLDGLVSERMLKTFHDLTLKITHLGHPSRP